MLTSKSKVLTARGVRAAAFSTPLSLYDGLYSTRAQPPLRSPANKRPLVPFQPGRRIDAHAYGLSCEIVAAHTELQSWWVLEMNQVV